MFRRGLTPPHRVKSISMTTFTTDEIEFLKSRGNEYCKYVWLGTFDTSTNSIESEVSDDQRKRDFMVQKYEKKRWYVDHEIAVKKMQTDAALRQKQGTIQSQTFGTKSNSVVETQPLSRLLGKSPTALVVQPNQAAETWPHPVSSASAPTISTKTSAQNPGSRSIDLLSEFAGDSSTSSAHAAMNNTSTANGNFANFETAFNSVEKSGWTSFDDDLDPLSPSASRSSTLSKDSVSRIGSYSSVMPRPLSLPTFVPTNPFKSSPIANPTTPSQWPSFAAGNAATAAAPTLPSSASLDAYPMQSRPSQPSNPVTAFSPPPPPPTSTQPAVQQQSTADRYAALADLDSLFNQPSSVKAPSWTVETTSSGSALDPVTSENGSTYSTAPSNPFASTDMWSQSQVKSSFQSANPFQTGTDGLSYSQTTSSQAYAPFPIPMVGNSPSDDNVRNQFNANFSPFPAQIVSPTNGYGTNPLLVQNGGLVSPTSGSGAWNMPSNMPMWSSSQMGLGGLFSNENKPSEPAQHSDWIQNPVNPFMVPTNNIGFPVAPKSNCSNPFL
ncbi:UNVERIFIED_CONTAM: Arf-GAP domain and FG repeat-containing protein 2 [Trichonephila clavipes]